MDKDGSGQVDFDEVRGNKACAAVRASRHAPNPQRLVAPARSPRPGCQFLEMMTARMTDKDSREDILKVFALFDAEGKGRITLRDLKRVAKELGETMSEAELLEMIERADSNGDGEVSREDFLEIMTKRQF